MDFEQLDQEVDNILSSHRDKSYAEIRQYLIHKGYQQEELKYILGLVDEKLLTNLESSGGTKTSSRNMMLGGAIGITGLVIIAASYFGQPVPKELNYIALVLFALGYLIFRKGYRSRDSQE